jgi:hypothetical protein
LDLNDDGSPIPLEEYNDLKKTLAESQLNIRRLVHSNYELKQEISMLRNMVDTCTTNLYPLVSNNCCSSGSEAHSRKPEPQEGG